MAPLPSPPVPDHCPSTFKYFLSVCVCTFQAEQIKKTKTILRAYICDIDGVYRRLSTTKNAGNQLGTRFFCGTGFYKRREINCKEKKKDELSPAIGENYINKNVSFLLIFYLCMFLLIANHKESEKNSHRKGR